MKHGRGFTLIEILVAFIMLGLVGGLLLQVFQGNLRNVRASAEYGHAALLARSKMTELLVVNDLRPGTRSGDFGDGYRWELTLSPYEGEPGELAQPGRLLPLQARLRISWGALEDRNDFVLDTLYLAARPARGS